MEEDPVDDLSDEDENPIIQRLKAIIFGGNEVEAKPSQKFSRVQFKLSDTKDLNRSSQFFKSCPCITNSTGSAHKSCLHKTSNIKMKIQNYENLSAQSSTTSVKPAKSQMSLTVMNVESGTMRKIPTKTDLREIKEPKIVVTPLDIEEVPSRASRIALRKNKIETLSEEKELDKFYNKLLMMDGEGHKKAPKSKAQDLLDDDGFTNLVKN